MLPWLWSTWLHSRHMGSAGLSYRKWPPHSPVAHTRVRMHRHWSAHLAGAGAPQVHAGAQPHAEHVER